MPDVFMGECPSVATVLGSEVRVSVPEPLRARQVWSWPIAHVACGEIIPEQLRTQWGVASHGARYDSLNGLRLGNARTNLTLGARSTSTTADDPLGPVANQRVGVATLTLGGRVRFKYWNDHAFWWWPMGDGGDQGDTAGLQFSYNLAPHHLRSGAWRFQQFNLTLRLASGIPDRKSAKPMGDGMVYTEVRFPQVDRGDLDLNATLTHRKLYRLDVGLTVNSGALRNVVQSKGVHRTLEIPEFPRTDHQEVTVYVRVTSW
jgi:hypothetical protein